eukprot:jgi/Mesen1/1279/ME000013S00771
MLCSCKLNSGSVSAIQLQVFGKVCTNVHPILWRGVGAGAFRVDTLKGVNKLQILEGRTSHRSCHPAGPFVASAWLERNWSQSSSQKHVTGQCAGPGVASLVRRRGLAQQQHTTALAAVRGTGHRADRRRGNKDKHWTEQLLPEKKEEESGADDNEIEDGPSDGPSEMELLERLVGKLERAPQRLSGYAFSRIMRSGRQTLTRWRAQQVVRMLGERGKWQRAVDVVCWLASREGERLQASRHIFTTLIAILGRQQSPDAVLEAFYAMMESYETWPDMPAYRAAAKALGRAGYLRQLLQVMADLRKGPDHGQKRFQVRGWSGVLAPDVHIYNSVMVRSGRADNAWAFWEHMNAAGLQPNSATYKSLVAAMGEAGRASVACELVVDMEQRGIDGSAS